MSTQSNIEKSKVIPTLSRSVLLINGLFILGLGFDYINSLPKNSWTVLNNLFTNDFINECSGNNNHLCWFSLIPFYGITLLIVGLFGSLAAILFRRFEAGVSLLLIGSLHLGHAYCRFILDSSTKFYQPGKASGLNRFQYSLAVIDFTFGVLLMMKDKVDKY